MFYTETKMSLCTSPAAAVQNSLKQSPEALHQNQKAFNRPQNYKYENNNNKKTTNPQFRIQLISENV